VTGTAVGPSKKVPSHVTDHIGEEQLKIESSEYVLRIRPLNATSGIGHTSGNSGEPFTPRNDPTYLQRPSHLPKPLQTLENNVSHKETSGDLILEH